MVRRHEKKYKKYLGSRTWGAGNTKNRRGAGNRGGKGYAGRCKHRWLHMIKYEPEKLGKRGFVSLKQKKKKEEKIINIDEINELIKSGKVEKKNNFYEFNFDGKVLGRGKIEFPIKLKAISVSKSAKEKIENAGGILEIAG